MSMCLGGGTGFIGKYLCRHLQNQGYDVTIISRMPGLKRVSWHDIQRTGIPKNITAVVNLAGQNVLDVTRRWTVGFKQNVWNSRVQTTSTLSTAISNAQNKPSSFVTISGVGCYNPDVHIAYDEDSKITGFDFFSRLCLEWELAARLPEDVPTRQVTVRSGVVLGRNGGMIKQLYLPFYFGIGGPVLPGNQYLPWIHIADLVRLILFAIENSNVSGIMNGVAPEVVTNKEFSMVS